MPEESRTCKTCQCYNAEAMYCRCRDQSEAEWNTCPDHETRDEFDARMKSKRAEEIGNLLKISEDPVDKLLGIVNNQLIHQRKQGPTHYLRGFIKGIEWTQTEIMKVFEK